MRKAIATLLAELMRSITWDQGNEMASHLSFTTITNRLLRQYLPKGPDLSIHSVEDVKTIQRSLNSRPRKPLGYRTPKEKLTELIALSI